MLQPECDVENINIALMRGDTSSITARPRKRGDSPDYPKRDR